jgi:hypothetical protein
MSAGVEQAVASRWSIAPRIESSFRRGLISLARARAASAGVPLFDVDAGLLQPLRDDRGRRSAGRLADKSSCPSRIAEIVVIGMGPREVSVSK